MNQLKGQQLEVPLSASAVRRRLKGVGLGVRKVFSSGRHQCVIIHTATGQHQRELEAIFHDVLPLKAPLVHQKAAPHPKTN